MNEWVNLYALVMIPAALGIVSGAVIYRFLPGEPLLAVILAIVIALSIATCSFFFNLDIWLWRTIEAKWPW